MNAHSLRATYRNAAGLCDRCSSILVMLLADAIDDQLQDDGTRMSSVRGQLAELQAECGTECGA